MFTFLCVNLYFCMKVFNKQKCVKIILQYWEINILKYSIGRWKWNFNLHKNDILSNHILYTYVYRLCSVCYETSCVRISISLHIYLVLVFPFLLSSYIISVLYYSLFSVLHFFLYFLMFSPFLLILPSLCFFSYFRSSFVCACILLLFVLFLFSMFFLYLPSFKSIYKYSFTESLCCEVSPSICCTLIALSFELLKLT